MNHDVSLYILSVYDAFVIVSLDVVQSKDTSLVLGSWVINIFASWAVNFYCTRPGNI